MDRKTFSKKIAEILFSKPPVTKGITIFKTVIWFVVTVYVAYVISGGFTQNVFRKENAGLQFIMLYTLILMINSWRRYFKQRLA